MTRILVIDDELEIRESIREFLQASGHSVIEAADGVTGVIEFGRHCIDLALVDMVMPHKEGVETIKEMRVICPTIKIIAMAGGVYRDLYLDIAAKLGADDILSKPFDPVALKKKIANLVLAPLTPMAS